MVLDYLRPGIRSACRREENSFIWDQKQNLLSATLSNDQLGGRYREKTIPVFQTQFQSSSHLPSFSLFPISAVYMLLLSKYITNTTINTRTPKWKHPNKFSHDSFYYLYLPFTSFTVLKSIVLFRGASYSDTVKHQQYYCMRLSNIILTLS